MAPSREQRAGSKQSQVVAKHTTDIPFVHRSEDVADSHAVALTREVEKMDAELVYDRPYQALFSLANKTDAGDSHRPALQCEVPRSTLRSIE